VILQLDVSLQRVRPAEHVRDHRVVDHQLGRHQRIHARRITTGGDHGVPHRGQISQHRYAVGVVQEHPGRVHLDLAGHAGHPVGQLVGPRPVP
jgi:hypothetical protein